MVNLLLSRGVEVWSWTHRTGGYWTMDVHMQSLAVVAVNYILLTIAGTLKSALMFRASDFWPNKCCTASSTSAST